MRARTILLIGALVAVAVVIALWPRRPNRAQHLATQAASAEQRRLWQEIAGRGTPPGLERLPVASRPIEPRRVQSARAPNQPAAPGRGSLAPGVETGIRVISTGGDPRSIGQPFGGTARVASVDTKGGSVELDLGGKRSLTFVARVGGMLFVPTVNTTVQVAFESSPDAFNRREILAVQAGTTLVASALESGDARITLKVGPPLNLTAVQDPMASPAAGSLPVKVTIGKTEVAMKPGDQPQSIEGIFVRLLGSVALPPGGIGDASPYAIDLIAWRQTGK